MTRYQPASGEGDFDRVKAAVGEFSVGTELDANDLLAAVRHGATLNAGDIDAVAIDLVDLGYLESLDRIDNGPLRWRRLDHE